MRILELHCDYFAQKPRSKAIKSLPELTDEEKAGYRVENALVVFTTMESADDLETVRKAAEQIKKNFLEVKAATVFINPYAHLSSDLAKPDKAQMLLFELWQEVRKYAPDAKKGVFGYYKEFELKCKGHPLSELSKTITSREFDKVISTTLVTQAKSVGAGEPHAAKSVASAEILQFAGHKAHESAAQVANNTAQFLLACAVSKVYPKAVVAASSAGEGFFADFEVPATFSQDDLAKIDAEMRKLAKGSGRVTSEQAPVSKALEILGKNHYRAFLLQSVAADSKVHLAQVDGFVDLVSGKVLEDFSKLAAFKLTKTGGAYWLDNASNKQLQRVTGIAFENAAGLDEYNAMMAEAERRDHRKLGKDLKIFMFSDEVGMGLPMWMPNGEILRHTLMEYMRDLEEKNGYKYVQTPSITKSQIFYTSGHLPHYKDSMYAPIDIEGSEYYLKPMNCPFHHMICRDLVVSYRDLPLRLAEPGSCYRYELSGTMNGIIRTRNFTQNDSHIYSTTAQAAEEFVSVLRLFKEVYEVMGIKDYWYRLSLPDFDNNPGKYAGGEDRKRWEWAAKLIRDAMKAEGEKFVEAVGEAAFYGPKIDVQIRNAFGKDDSIATIQVDVLMAKRFNLTYANEKGEKEHMVIIHRAILGSFERFIAFLLEQYAGNLPTWLSPVQATVMAITDEQAAYAKQVASKLEKKGVRVSLDASHEKIEHKIRDAQLQKIPYMLIVGKKEADAQTVSVRTRKGEVRSGVGLVEFERELLEEIASKKA